MSFTEFLDFSLCDDTPLGMALVTHEELSIGDFLEPLPSAFGPDLFPGSVSSGDVSTDYSYSSHGLNVLEERRPTTSAPPEPTIWLNELSPTCFFPPLESEIIHDIPRPFDGAIPVGVTHIADVQRYMQRSGKVPYINIFAPEEDEFDTMKCPNSDDVFSDVPADPSTPVQRRAVPPPKHEKRIFSRSSSVTGSDTSDYAPSPRRNRSFAQEATSKRISRAKARTAAIILDESEHSHPAKKAKSRKTFNSACAADNLASFAPIHSTVFTYPAVASSSAGSSLTPSSTTTTSTSFQPEEVRNRKRKLKEIDSDDNFEVDSDGDRRAAEQWKPNPEGKPYSYRTINSRTVYRCDLCLASKITKFTTRGGDMDRHLESKQHQEKKFPCSRCQTRFTRTDSLKRHQMTCRD